MNAEKAVKRIPDVVKGIVALSAKQPERKDNADVGRESDHEDPDIRGRKTVANGLILSNTQKTTMDRNKSDKLTSAKNSEKDENGKKDVINNYVALSTKRPEMKDTADDSTESASTAMSDKNLRMNKETPWSPKDKVYDMPYLPLQKLQGHAGDMKAEVDQTETVSVLKQLVQLAASVGLIRSTSACGTGFHVGPGYIMTAKHVVDQILKGAPVLLRQQKQISPNHQLSSKNVFIEFSYERNGQISDENHRFHFEPLILYMNDVLDTAILKLKKDPNKRYPPHLTTFAQLPNDGCSGYLIGHPNADVKKTDKYQCVPLVPQTINDARKWSLECAKVDGFSGIDDPRRILLHCSLNKGASGAPGFWICPYNGEAYVVLMLLRGYPEWYYDDKCRQETKNGIHPTCLIEQGVSMTSVYEDMKTKAPTLWKEIFCCSGEGEEMEE